MQILDLVTESDTIEVTKPTDVSYHIPPRKRPKISVDINHQEALIMPEPSIDHQVKKLQ